MMEKTCVSPSGEFEFGLHRPEFRAENFRGNTGYAVLGQCEDGSEVDNQQNFPSGAIAETCADPIYEIRNPFPFRGATFIIKKAADRAAEDPCGIGLPKPQEMSFSRWLSIFSEEAETEALFRTLPSPVKLAVASNSTDPEDLIRMAKTCCEFIHDPKTGEPKGLKFRKNDQGRCAPRISDHELFEVLANNIHLPDSYKRIMVLKPGVQGGSEIMGEWLQPEEESHVYEYLRRNSYIPWGHYAANMADDAVRYRAGALSPTDMQGMRHLYYQRTYSRIAELLGLSLPDAMKTLPPDQLEALRMEICEALHSKENLQEPAFNATLWGWNYGFDFAPSRYRLHASHQQIHQQYAMIPRQIAEGDGYAPFAFGDLIADFIRDYRSTFGVSFFDAYLSAIRRNRRMDGLKNYPSSLILYEDDSVILFAPKAQTSQWELQLMTVRPVGNILEADAMCRASLDKAMLLAVQVLERLGARMVTHIEASKRIGGGDTGQRLMYFFLPKLPYSPGSFTEAQLRWINGHYPEDFAEACRRKLKDL